MKSGSSNGGGAAAAWRRQLHRRRQKQQKLITASLGHDSYAWLYLFGATFSRYLGLHADCRKKTGVTTLSVAHPLLITAQTVNLFKFVHCSSWILHAKTLAGNPRIRYSATVC